MKATDYEPKALPIRPPRVGASECPPDTEGHPLMRSCECLVLRQGVKHLPLGQVVQQIVFVGPPTSWRVSFQQAEAGEGPKTKAQKCLELSSNVILCQDGDTEDESSEKRPE